MSKFASKENLQYLWKKSKVYTDEKLAMVPGAAGYLKGDVLVIDNLEGGEYGIVYKDMEDNIIGKENIVHKSPAAYNTVRVPAGCKYIDIYKASGEIRGRVRTDTVTVPVPDFSENDETSPNFIAGRTHWFDYTPLMPETVLQYNEDISGYMISEPVDVSAYSHCTVAYNGVDYVCPVFFMSMGDTSGYALGNYGLITGTGDSGEPFVIGLYTAELAEETGMYGMVMSTEGLTSDITLAIGGGKGIVKLDNKFLDLDWIPAEYVVDGDELLGPVTASDNGMIPRLTSSELAGQNEVVVYCDSKRYIQRIYQGSLAGMEEGTAIIGNIGLLSGDAGNSEENFVFIVLPQGTMTGFTDNGTHTISVYKKGIATSKMPEKFMPESVDGIVLRSSTAGSTKLFRLTVNDSGALTATEIKQ